MNAQAAFYVVNYAGAYLQPEPTPEWASQWGDRETALAVPITYVPENIVGPVVFDGLTCQLVPAP